MPIRNRILATTVALSMLAPSCGAAEAKKPSIAGTLERTPRLNADGNYNIVFIITDQEHHFRQYPEGSAYEARQMLAELGTTFENHDSRRHDALGRLLHGLQREAAHGKRQHPRG
jgi:hypothetical protein